MMQKTTEIVAVVFSLLIILVSPWVLIRHSSTVNNNSYLILIKDKLPEIVLKSQLLGHYTVLPDSKNNEKCLPFLTSPENKEQK